MSKTIHPRRLFFPDYLGERQSGPIGWIKDPDSVIPYEGLRKCDFSRPVNLLLVSVIQKGTRVLISLWDSLMFGRVPKKRRGVFGYPPEHERIP